MLEWARARGCPWDAWCCAEAARKGNLETLEWLRARGCPWDRRTCASAWNNGHFHVYDWARANGCRNCDSDDMTGRSDRSNALLENIEIFFPEDYEDEDVEGDDFAEDEEYDDFDEEDEGGW